MSKSPEAFRTISEVSQDISVPKHVLKFWEGKFAQLRPMKRRGGRRYYRPKDINLLHGIRHLLYNERYTVKGVQKILQEKGVRFVMESWQPAKQGDTISSQGILDVTTRTANCETLPSKLVIGNSLEGCRTVSEVSKALGVPKHVLKFWEGKFTQLRPTKRGGRQLYYRLEDIDFLLGVRQLLYTDKYSIDGVQKILQERGVRFVMDYRQPVKQGNAAPTKEIRDVDISPDVAGIERPVGKPGADYKQARQKVAA